MKRVTESENSDFENDPAAPDGGWGYVVTGSVILLNYATYVPLLPLGLLYGPFLASVGDETRNTALLASTYIAVASITGFASCFLLKTHGTRTTAFIGASAFSLGYFLEIFGTNSFPMIICCGVLKGFGYGLLLPSSFTVMNNYFVKKLSLMIGISQTVTALGTILSPLMISYLMDNLGFRKTLSVLAGISLLNFPAVLTFRPVKKHSPEAPKLSATSGPSNKQSQVEPLLPPSEEIKVNFHQKLPMPENATSSSGFDLKDWLLDGVGLRFFADLKYIIMVVGISLPYISDATFVSLIRMILNNLHYESTVIALMTTVLYACDVAGRLSYSIMSGFFTFKNRGVFLVAVVFIALFRIAFVLRDGYTWKMVTIGMIGFVKGVQETSLPLVISDTYKDSFSTAYSIFMVLSGCLFSATGALTSYVKDLTQSNTMIIYLFALLNAVTCIAWTMETIFCRLRKKALDYKLNNQLKL